MTREHIEAVGKAFGMTLAGFGVGWMAIRMYSEPGTALRQLLFGGIAPLFDFGYGVPEEMMLSVFLGFLLVTLGFFTADWRKQVPGILFGIFLGVMTLTLAASGIWLPNLQLSAPNGIAFFTGGVFAFLFQYTDLKRQRSAEGDTDYEFNRAILLLPMIFTIVVLASYVQALVAGVSIFLIDTVATFGFLYLMIGLVSYDQTVPVMPYGVAETGKTVGWYEKYSALVENYPGHISASDKLQEFDEQMVQLTQGDSIDSAIPGTTLYDRIEFSVPIGNLFPLRMHLDLFDMEGDIAPSVAHNLEDWSIRETLFAQLYSFKLFLDKDVTPDQAAIVIANRLRNAEVVTLFIDLKKVNHNESTGTRYLKTVAEELNTRNVHLIPVASKADVVSAELFNPDHIFRATPDGGLIRDVEDPDFESFADRIERWLRSNNRQAGQLIDLCDEETVYPVGMKMTTNVNDEEVPDLDENGREQTFGFAELAHRILQVVSNRV